MKGFKMALLVLLSLLFTMATVLAAEPISLVNLVDRAIVSSNSHPNDNPIIEGISPITGLAWEGEYMPMMAIVSSPNGGVGGKNRPWNASHADIIYETPIHKNGSRRMLMLFSDNIPEDVGPIRSARVQHIELREQWDAGLVFHGMQEYEGSNVNDSLRTTGAKKRGLVFNGTDGGKDWKKFHRREIEGLGGAPDNVVINLAGVQTMLPQDHSPKMHPFLFRDDLDYEGDTANEINIVSAHKDYSSIFVYDADLNKYIRFVGRENIMYTDGLTDEPITFSNLIIQRTNVSFKRNDAPYVTLIGSGNADIFIAGKYIPGYWVRNNLEDRTVFFDASGSELELQRGKTFISIQDHSSTVNYQD